MDEETVRMFVSEGNIQGLINYCVGIELDEKHSPNGVAPSEVYLVLLAAYLIEQKLRIAKYLWKRIPQTTKQACPELFAVWHIAQAMWLGNSPKEALLAYSWNGVLKVLITELTQSIVNEGFRQVSMVYTKVDVNTVIRKTGLSEADAIKHANLALDWEYDADSKMFTVVREVIHKAPTASSLLEAKGISSLTTTIVQLEA
eukprot:gene7727-9924_t